MARRRNKSEEREVAQQRITLLLDSARRELGAGRADVAQRQSSLALRVAEKYQTGLSRGQKAQVCRKCGTLRTAATSRSRLRSGRIAVTCLACGAVARKPLATRAVKDRAGSTAPSRGRQGGARDGGSPRPTGSSSRGPTRE